MVETRRSRRENEDHRALSPITSTPPKRDTSSLVPGKSFAEALRASLSNLKKSIPTEHVTPVGDHDGDTSPTSLETDFIESSSTIDKPIEIDPLEKEKNKKKMKKRWNEEDKKEVVWCYYLAKSKGLKKVKGTFSIWRKRNPNKHPSMNEISLNNQLNSIMKKLSVDELHRIEDEVEKKRNRKVKFAPIINENSTDEIEKIENHTKTSDQKTIVDEETQLLVDKYKYEILVKYKEELNRGLEERTIPTKIKYCKQSLKKIAAANIVLEDIVINYKDELEDCSNMNTLIYATATTIAGHPKTPDPKISTSKRNPHFVSNVDKMDGVVDRQPVRKQRYCEKGIVKLRRNIGRLTDLNKNPSPKKMKRLKHLLKGEDIKTVIQNLRMKLAARSKKLRNTKSKKTRFENNKLFYTQQKQFYSHLKGDKSKKVSNPPKEKDIENFWNGIWGDDTPHNQDAGWIKSEEREMEKIKTQKWKRFTLDELSKQVKRTKNWKAPGIDKVQNYWLKHLPSLWPIMTDTMNEMIENPTLISKWMTKGKTTHTNNVQTPDSNDDRKSI